MRIKVQRNKLNDAIGKCMKAVANKPIIPSTANILLSPNLNTLMLSATDTTLSIRQFVDCEQVGKPGEIHQVSVSAKVLSGIISSLTKDFVELDIQENAVKISADGTNLSLPVMSGVDFPALPEPSKKLLVLSEDRIDELNSLSVPFCSTDSSREVLNGLRIRRKEGKIEFMACDGYRYSYTFADDTGEDFDINVPSRAFKELKGLGEVEVWISEAGNQAVFQGTTGFTSSTLLETHGYFELPTYVRNGFDPKIHTRVTFPINTLIGAVKLAASVSNEINHQVDLDFVPGSTTVSIAAAADGRGSGTVESQCGVEGLPVVVAFDSNYLSQTLDAMKNRPVVMELETGDKMAQFSVQGKDGFVHGLLPLNRQNRETK